MINTEALQQELEHERQINKIDDTSGDTNPYRKLIINNAEKIEPLLKQMEPWSILSSMLNYIQYEKHQKNFHNLGISSVNIYKISFKCKSGKGYNRNRLWPNTICIKGRISRHIQGNPVRNSKNQKF